ncbi:short-chain fatty acid transporter [uncultured Serinicoccus sp.]|uniref:short-chain fatty acid transporter n=1 Tax=uncultured Serinicoccus sp. TaxID=735514 RepID=UPI0026039402|nr:TIGR00366 family protein [uncultured Serinicoccus sp.]
MSQTQPRTRTGVQRAMGPLNSVVERFIPSALVFAIVLTVLVMVAALGLTDAGPVDVVRTWGDGLSGLLAFMTQMALILLLGYILANTGPVRAGLRRLAAVPRGRVMPYVFVALVTCVAGLFTWGLGLVVGALLAKEVAAGGRRRGEPRHFPLLVAAGYTGMVVWHMGYSGSAPLVAATPDSFVSEQLGQPLPITETTFSTWNIITALLAVAVVAGTIALMAPRHGAGIVEMPEHRMADDEVTYDVTTPADRLDASRVLTLVPGLLLLAYLVIHFSGGGTITLDIVNWSFLTLCLLLVRNPFEIIELTQRAASNVGEILLQFPLYAGIMGIMAGTGLITVLSEALVSVSTPATFGLLAFLSAGIVNFFVPSGGGQIAVQGPVLLEAASSLGVDPEVAVMAIAYGDQWTNMIQPFWALPLLAIAGLKIRDILGYTTVILLTTGVLFAAALLVLGSGV